MHIEVANNNGTRYFRLARCRRGRNKDGAPTILKDIVLNIGPLLRYDDGKPDHLGRLRESFRAGAPPTPALKPYAGKAAETHVIRYRDGDPSCEGPPSGSRPAFWPRSSRRWASTSSSPASSSRRRSGCSTSGMTT